jgi:hypothetical protein
MIYSIREVSHNKHIPLCLTVKNFSHPLCSYKIEKDLAVRLQGLFACKKFTPIKSILQHNAKMYHTLPEAALPFEVEAIVSFLALLEKWTYCKLLQSL